MQHPLKGKNTLAVDHICALDDSVTVTILLKRPHTIHRVCTQRIMGENIGTEVACSDVYCALFSSIYWEEIFLDLFIYCLFYMRDNTCDSLYAFLYTEMFHHKDSSLTGEICSPRTNYF